MNPYWQDRGTPSDYDPGPPAGRDWARLFAATPNYRALGHAVVGREAFRWHFGPMFYRGRLEDGAVKVIVIGQEGAQDESLAHRSFTGGTGARMQYFLKVLGITQSYLFLNTFVYPIFGQYTDDLRPLAQDPESPIVKHRHAILDYALERNDVHLVVAVGNAAKESVVTWVRSRGGTCPQGPADVSTCAASSLDPRTRLIGVMHPGGANKGGSVTAIIADFKRAVAQIKAWMDADPTWLPPDPGAPRLVDQPYVYRSAPIPFRDLPFGVTWRLGSGGTVSNRKDNQRSIQLYSAAGKYDAKGAHITYPDNAPGDAAGYQAAPGDLPCEPPKADFAEYDAGPGPALARLLMGNEPGLPWPDFAALGARAHPSLGTGPVYRGRPDGAAVLVLADQESQDDLFTQRAMTGDGGQHFQAYLTAIGLIRSYLILRALPINTLDLAAPVARAMVDDPQVRALYQAAFNRVVAGSPALGLVLTVGPLAARLAGHLSVAGRPVIALKAWREAGAVADWQQRLAAIRQVAFPRDIPAPTFHYGGERGQIPRIDLPFATLRWQGTSGARARQATDTDTGKPSPDYFKVFVPDWVYRLPPTPLTAEEQAAVDRIGH
jgi:hypothetical protein